jgi:hypothetical protein
VVLARELDVLAEPADHRSASGAAYRAG